MTMSAQELQQLYTLTKQHYSSYKPDTNTQEALALRVKQELTFRDTSTVLSSNKECNIDRVVGMYLEVKRQSTASYTSTAGSPSVSTRRMPEPSTDTSSWWRGWHMPSFTYFDNRWDWSTRNTTTNTTNHNHDSAPDNRENGRNPRDKQEPTVQQRLKQIGIMVIGAIVSAIAMMTLLPLCYEIFNHISRIWHNEGTAQGSLLLLGVATSYCLAMFSVYEIAGGLVMGLMMAAGFANPAAWACAAIALTAVIATPLFNMFIREGIYTMFSAFDDQALVSTDNRFRVLTPAEEENLDNCIDADRVNFATLCKYDELKPTQTRQRFAFFDYNSDAMSRVLGETRAMRYANQAHPLQATHQESIPVAEVVACGGNKFH